jgi:hypothetical protein
MKSVTILIYLSNKICIYLGYNKSIIAILYCLYEIYRKYSVPVTELASVRYSQYANRQGYGINQRPSILIEEQFLSK